MTQYRIRWRTYDGRDVKYGRVDAEPFPDYWQARAEAQRLNREDPATLHWAEWIPGTEGER